MKEFIRKHEDRIHGVLSCFDRMLFRGYLPIMSGWAWYLRHHRPMVSASPGSYGDRCGARASNEPDARTSHQRLQEEIDHAQIIVTAGT